MYDLARRALFALDPEVSHDLSITALRCWGDLPSAPTPLAGDAVEVLGCRFPNRVGLAAGLDKSAKALVGFARQGFGFVEVGTVTPRPQSGNPKPRLFRLPEHDALINRMGFNNDGAEVVARRLARHRRRLAGTVVGVNIGKNKTTPNEEAADDYQRAMTQLYDVADYFVANLSSPNTPGLRSLQSADELASLCQSLREVQRARTEATGRRVAFCVKVAPDLADEDIDAIAEVLSDGVADGLIATNTTVARDAVLGHKHANEAGGLSGAPLRERSPAVVERFASRLPASVPVIGAGGVFSPQDGQRMLDSGAVLVQIYTGFIYRGPPLVRALAGLHRNG